MTIYMLAVHLFGLFALAQSSTRQGFQNKVLVFPNKTNNSYVTLKPLNKMPSEAFTLCLRVATELPYERQFILFSYRTANDKELSVWREKDGRVCLRMGNDQLYSSLPPLGTFRTSLCVTWESQSGLTAFWVDGKRSTYQVFRKGNYIHSGGTIILGQYSENGQMNPMQSLVGEITDVNMWDSVLSKTEIDEWYKGNTVHQKGSVFSWLTIGYNCNGDVLIVDDV